MHRSHIVVLGSSNVDMIVKSVRIPLPGETITGGKFFCVPGGKGANQAVAAARLGARVTFIARVGDDVQGAEALEGYRKEGIDVSYVFRSQDVPTGVALILVNDAGENLISVASGANDALSVKDVQISAEVIRSASVLLLQLESPMETVIAAARAAHEANVPVILDPAPAPDLPLEPELLRLVSYLTPNETEASRLTGIEVHDDKSSQKAADALLALGVGCVVLKRGSDGALIASGAGATMIEGFPVDAVDTTAAGDAFNGGLAVAIAAGKTLRDAVVEACAVGALATLSVGAQPSLPHANDVRMFLNARSAGGATT